MKDRFKEGDVVVVIFHDHGTRYLGKMFNDDWMRDRGFLEEKSPKAIDLIERHKHLSLVTIDASEPVQEAFSRMRKFDISQIPVASIVSISIQLMSGILLWVVDDLPG